MTVALRMFPAAGIVALFDEASGGGDVLDITSPCNRPANDPANWLGNLYFHSSLDNLEVLSDTTVTISHSSVAGSSSAGLSGSGGGGDGGAFSTDTNSTVLRYNRGATNRLLVTHSLGYVPDAIALVGDQVLFPGRPVQTQSGGRSRYCSLYLTTTEARLYEWASVSGSTLSSTSLDYRVLLFRQQRAASGNKLFDFDPATGITKMGFDRFSTDRNYLQVVPGGSPFGIAYGKTMQLRNGAPRFVNPDGTQFEPVPAALKLALGITCDGNTYSGSLGSSMAYSGSFTGPTQILVQAP